MRISHGQITIKKDLVLPNIIKFLLVLMMIYEGWYLEKYTAIPGVLQMLALLIVGATLILLLRNSKNGKNKQMLYWALFGAYSLIAAFIVDANMTIVLDSIVTYFSFIAVIYCGGVVSKYTSDYAWFSKTILIVSLISAYCAYFHGVPYQNGLYFVTTMSEYNNPNNLGLLMSIGTFVIAFPEHKPGLLGWCVRLYILVMFLVVTINTGSRSSLLCELAVITLFLYSLFKNMRGGASELIIKRMALVLVVYIAVIFVLEFVDDNNLSGSAIRRLFDKFNSDSFSGRTDLYDLAWEMYKENPLFGIGYNCFASASTHGYFTHSTYMELLACTGTIGFFLFLTPVLAGTWRGIMAFRIDGGRAATIMLMMLISGFFGIVYYNMVFLMVLYIESIRIPKTGGLT